MTVKKITVSLPAPAVDRVRAAVKAGQAASVSASVAAAHEEKARLEDLDSLLEAMLAETGGAAHGGRGSRGGPGASAGPWQVDITRPSDVSGITSGRDRRVGHDAAMRRDAGGAPQWRP